MTIKKQLKNNAIGKFFLSSDSIFSSASYLTRESFFKASDLDECNCLCKYETELRGNIFWKVEKSAGKRVRDRNWKKCSKQKFTRYENEAYS